MNLVLSKNSEKYGKNKEYRYTFSGLPRFTDNDPKYLSFGFHVEVSISIVNIIFAK